MRKTLLTALLTAVALVAGAQPDKGTLSLIPKVGLTMANMTGSDLSFTGSDGDIGADSKYQAGFTAGAELDYQALHWASVSLGVMYYRQGCKYDDVAVVGTQDEDNVYYTLHTGMKNDMQYINVPLMFNFYPLRNFAIKVGAQLDIPIYTKETRETVSMTVDRDTDMKTYSDDFTREKTNVEANYKEVGVSVPVGISYEYENVIIDFRYNIGISDICKSETQRNQVFALTVGYRIKFN